MVDVILHEADGSQRIISCDKDSIMIGRALGNDICLDLVGVSRYHARLSVEGSQISIQDLSSTNGTFVNSESIREAVLRSGDKVTIGSALFSVALRDGDPAPASTPAAATDEAPADRSKKRPVTGTAIGMTSKELMPDRSAAEKAQRATITDDSVSKTVAAARASEDAKAKEGPEKAGSNSSFSSVQLGDRVLTGEEAFYWRSLENFLGPIWPYVTDDAVSEIMINGPTEIYIEKKGHLDRIKESFSESSLHAAVLNIAQYVGRRVSEEEPYLDARLPDGSRVAVLLPPCSRKGTSVSIRKFSKEKLTLERLIGFGSLSSDMVSFLRAAVLLKKNIIVSGGTSSGKTSLLNVVSGLIPADERILTIEDSAELQLSQEHVVPMETKPPDKKGRGQVTIRDLVRASLRMRPDRIVVGEIRSGEALDLLQAMNTGHSGSMATVHASSPAQALTRLETLALFSGVEIPIRALREQVSTAIEVVIQASRLPDHSRKVTHITEVNRLSDQGNYQVTDIFRFQNEGRDGEGKIKGRHIWTGNAPSFLGEMELAGLTEMVGLFQKAGDGKSTRSQDAKGVSAAGH